MDSDIVQRGERAKALLEDPLIHTILEEQEAFLVEAWKSSSVPEAREELWFTLKGLERFKSQFEAAIQSGAYELAQHEGTR